MHVSNLTVRQHLPHTDHDIAVKIMGDSWMIRSRVQPVRSVVALAGKVAGFRDVYRPELSTLVFLVLVSFSDILDIPRYVPHVWMYEQDVGCGRG